jgi:starch synthase
MKIALITSEAVPFAKTGGLGDVVTALGKELVKLGNEVTLFLPLYPNIAIVPTRVISPLSLRFAGRHLSYSLIESNFEGIRVIFVDAPAYFHRSGLYGDSHGDYKDNDERFTFFNRACLEYYVRREERPDIFHCNDWPTGPLPVFLRTHYLYEEVSKSPVLFTIHNLAYQGNFPAERFTLLELGGEFFTSETLEFYGLLSFLKAGLVFSDILTTVSKRYSQEIQTPEFGYRMDGVLRSRSNRLFGVLNGIDEEVWNPQKDKMLARQYSIDDLSGKEACKRDLLSAAGLDSNTSWPVIGIISRLAAQKGIDLFERSAHRILDMHTLMVVLGSGEARYEQFLEKLRRSSPRQVAVSIKFDEVLAHKIEAGADMFLMPSRYEPCGLNQMYSLKYGTVPIVRATGGLDDTVEEWNPEYATGTGFKFSDYQPDALLDACARARNAFENKDAWRKLIQNGMRANYSWKTSAIQYLSLYDQAIQLKTI